MVTSIVLTDKYSIGVDANGKFMFNGSKISIKDVPFVRYRFENYGEAEIDYIRAMKNKFKYSSHMAEITLGENTADTIDLVHTIENIIVYVYINVSDDNVANGFSESVMSNLDSIEERFIDRLMLKDKSSSLDLVTSIRLKKSIIEHCDFEINDIGVCSSPLSFNNGNACLTAVKARELSADYAENDEVALPSSNHESMNCCGCIKYCTINNNIEVDKTAKCSTKKTSTKNSSNNNDSENKTQKQVKFKGFLKW